MTLEEFAKLMDEMYLECNEIMQTKGLAYSGKEDKLGNFKRIAKTTGLSPETVLYIYVAKHWDSIGSYIRGEYCDSEPIKGRIKDVINYMFLLAGILQEKGKLNGNTK